MSTNLPLSMRHNNFDLMRFVAATAVLVSHSYPLYGLGYEPVAALTGFEMLGGYAVAVFFIISGYLITASYDKKPDPVRFTLNRVLRIFPALMVLLLLSTLLIGLFVSTMPFSEFIRHPQTLHYFRNILLYPVEFLLPGTFEELPVNSVNGSLWTLSLEFSAYICVLVLGVLRLLKAAVLLAVCVGFLVWYQYVFDSNENAWLMSVKYMAKNGCFFFAGSVCYAWRHKMVWKWYIALLCIGVMAFTAHSRYMHVTYMIALPYVVLYLAQIRQPRLNRFGAMGDFSYGMYLYAFPIQQSYMYFVGDKYGFETFMAVSWLCTLLCAYGSWHGVEKHALKLKDMRMPAH